MKVIIQQENFKLIFSQFYFCHDIGLDYYFVLMPKLAPLVAPGFGTNEIKELVMLSRIMLCLQYFRTFKHVRLSCTDV